MSGAQEQIKIHDKYQFEMKFTYPIDLNDKRISYQVETYMFMPNNLGVTPKTYGKEDFYGDAQTYIRFKTPDMPLKSIVKGDKSPLKALEKALKDIAVAPADPERENNYKQSLKMFCSVLKSSLRDEEAFIERLGDNDKVEDFVKDYNETASSIVKEFRALRKLAHVPLLQGRPYALYLLADEHISLTVDKYRYRLLLALNRLPLPDPKKPRAALLEAINAETLYRDANKYPSVPRPGSDNEVMLYRMSALKKIMSSILFLKTQTRREGVYLEQLSMGLAAGIAMAFATAVAFIGQDRLGNLSLTFFVTLVVAYIFKDRMKELTRIFIYRKLQKRLYDQKTVIRNGIGNTMGVHRQSFQFMDEAGLPPELVKIRNKDYITELDNGYLGEQILYEKKQVTLFGGVESAPGLEGRFAGINEITRHNISKFLSKMDNARKLLYIADKNGTRETKASRVYHVHLVTKFGQQGKPPAFHHFRLILSQNGIKRIEAVPV